MGDRPIEDDAPADRAQCAGEVPPDVAAVLAAALAASDVMVALWDADDRLRWANAAYANEFLRGLAPPVSFGDVLRHGFHHGFGVRIDRGDIEAFLAEVLPRRRSTAFRGIEVDTVADRWLWMSETVLPSGWLLSMGSDITKLKVNERLLRQAQRRAEQAARTDPLTGAPNRRHIVESGEAGLQRTRKAGRPFSVALIDLDRFKQINDTFGHDAGDAVLRAFAAHCQKSIRQADLFGRFGGEEFVLALPDVDAGATTATLDRLRRQLEPLALGPAEVLRYGFSAGIAQASHDDDFDALVKRADRALYRAKANGRGRNEIDGG